MSKIGEIFKDWLDGGDESADNLDPNDAKEEEK